MRCLQGYGNPAGRCCVRTVQVVGSLVRRGRSLVTAIIKGKEEVFWVIKNGPSICMDYVNMWQKVSCVNNRSCRQSRVR